MDHACLIKADTVLYGPSFQEHHDQVVLIREGKIARVTSREDLQAEYHGVPVITLSKPLVLMCGLIDAHSHVTQDVRLPGQPCVADDSECAHTLIALKALRDDVEAGITTMRCLGDRYGIDIVLRDKIAAGEVVGPRLQVAGIGIRSLHDRGHVGQGLSGADEVRRLCRQNLYRTTEWLKIFVTSTIAPGTGTFVPHYFSREEIAVVAREANACGCMTSAHCIGGIGLRFCVEEGINVLEHAFWATREDIELMLRHKTWICFTPGVFLDEDREKNCKSDYVKRVRAAREQVAERIATIVKAGVRYVIGTGANHGLLHRELMLMHRLGAAPVDILQGVTSRAAQLMNLDGITGTLAEGYEADLIAVEGNPLQDMQSLSRVAFVMKGGRVLKGCATDTSIY